MDIGTLSHEQLLQLIIFSGAGAILLAVLFVGALIVSIRKFRKSQKSSHTFRDDGVGELPTDQGEKPMSLLKSYGNEEPSEPAPIPPETGEQVPEELMRVLMHPSTGNIILEVNGVQYADLKAISDRSIGQRILETAAAVLNFTHGIIATAEGAKSIPVPKVSISPITAQQASLPKLPESEPDRTISRSDLAARQQFLADLEAQSQASRLQKPSPRSRWGRKRKQTVSEDDNEETGTPLDLAGQIDEIVQKQWLASGLTDEVKIHSVPGGGIRIQVGQNFYDAVDAVENLNARALIQSAIKVWEAR